MTIDEFIETSCENCNRSAVRWVGRVPGFSYLIPEEHSTEAGVRTIEVKLNAKSWRYFITSHETKRYMTLFPL